MANNIRGPGAFSYLGVNAINPPNMRVLKRAPTSTDTKNVTIGDFWLDSVSLTLYQLVNLDADTATWNVVISSNNNGATINTAGQLLLESSDNNVNAISINATNAAGGIDMTSGTGGIGIDTTGSVIIESQSATFPSIQLRATDAGGSIRLQSPSGIVNSNGTGAGTSAAQILVGNIDPNATIPALRGSLFMRTDAGNAGLYVNTDNAVAWTALT